MARVEKFNHTTQITGSNNPAKQVSKDNWNLDAHNQTGVDGYDEPSETLLVSDVASPANTPGLVVIGAESGTADEFKTLTTTDYKENDLVRVKSTTGDVITVKHGTGNIFLKNNRDVVLSDVKEMILRHDGTNWEEVVSTDLIIVAGNTVEVLDY